MMHHHSEALRTRTNRVFVKCAATQVRSNRRHAQRGSALRANFMLCSPDLDAVYATFGLPPHVSHSDYRYRAASDAGKAFPSEIVVRARLRRIQRGDDGYLP